MKRIKYFFSGREKSISCADSDLDANYAVAQSEADGEIIVEDIEPTKEERLAALHRNLADTDYIAAKIAEGAATREEYAKTIAKRQSWREEINRLEEELADGEG